ncbi:U2 snRNP-associated SURP domain-containing protein [Xylographa bjoerkii]|nr:U2 snRNP-associated SURP domain-containing protein [Xylographa bjoerkii]
MTQNSKIKEFPDIGSKLTAPTKKSLFERQKAEAEAKRQREQQETAAVYEDFVKSFDDADNDVAAGPSGRLGGAAGSIGPFGGPSKRHFSGPPAGSGGRGSSGPGSLGPPPSSLSRKRAFDGTPSSNRDSSQGLFAFEDSVTASLDTKAAFQTSDDEEEKTGRSRAHDRAAPKPTIHLSSLPPGTSPAVVKSILPSNLQVDAVRLLPPTGPAMERRSLSAIVTLAKDTPAIDIDTAVSALQNKYLGWGFCLSLSRHLSSAAIGSGMPAPIGLSSTSSLPFGAKPIPAGPGGGFSRGLPTSSHRGGYAPPSSYVTVNSGPFGRGPPPVQVNVAPPADLKQLKLIHKTLEALLTHGPEFEALLMSRSAVQKEEKWAWLWDSRSVGGIWYRWRLWDLLTGAQQRIKTGRTRNSDSSQYVFDGGATWAAPERVLPFEYTTAITEFVSDSEYDSSDDEDSGDEGRRRHQHYQGGAPPPEGMLGAIENDSQSYLNPLQKAKLVHLLARLPITNAKLRRGDVARVTAFAIQHAGEGAEEVVDLITSNVHTPFAFSSANPEYKLAVDAAAAKSDEESAEDDRKPTDKEDTSPAKLIALYIISDILSSSSTSGVRHAWRYRQLFEASLSRRQTFAQLGRLEKSLSWGRLRAEKWKRSVQSVLSLWEGWCVFPAAAQEAFAASFANPPLTAQEEAEAKDAERAVAAAMAGKSKWKTVAEKAQEREAKGRDADAEPMDVDGEPMVDEDVDGEPMADEDEDVDGAPMDDTDGEPMAEDAGDQHAATQSGPASESVAFQLGVQRPTKPGPGAAAPGSAEKTLLPGGRRRRPKAEDMFADSDGE